MIAVRKILPTISLFQMLWLVLLSLTVAVLLGSLFYATRSEWHGPAWRTLGLLHVVFGCLALLTLKDLRSKVLKFSSHWTFALAPLILASTLVMCAAIDWRGKHASTLFANWGYFLATITWIPLFEEIVYRGALGQFFRAQGGAVWGAYFGTCVFSMAHSEPTWAKLASGQLGFALGPFLLGLCCEYIFLKSKNIWPCVAFHAACNSTAILFTLYGAAWLENLSFLYS
jgi:membrane protease YdiL (CAAX protease family)